MIDINKIKRMTKCFLEALRISETLNREERDMFYLTITQYEIESKLSNLQRKVIRTAKQNEANKQLTLFQKKKEAR